MKGLGLWIVVIVIFAAGFGCYNYIHGSNENNGNTNKPKIEQQIDNSKKGAETSTSQPQEKKTAEESKPAESTKSSGDVLNVSDINKSLMGKTVTVQCLIKNVNQPKNTVFFDVVDPSSGKTIKGVLFNKTNNDNQGRKELLEESMRSNRLICITGEIDEYKGNLEIKAWKVFTK